MTTNPYSLKYKLEVDNNNGKGFSKDELQKEGAGGTDALLIVSIIRKNKKAHGGALSVQIYSCDGANNNNEIPHTELFTIWSMIASTLANSEINTWQQLIAQEAFESVRSYIIGNRKDLK